MEHLNAVWLWLSDEENWERFDIDDVSRIEHAISIDNKGVVLERNYTTYFVDMLRLTQTNASTGRRRPIYRVKKGFTWLIQDAGSEQWKPFSREETEELEMAFFDGKELLILQRGTETHYVDFTKWTVADLSTGSTRHMKVTDEELESLPEDGASPSRSPSPQSQVVKPVSLSQVRMQKEMAKQKQQQNPVAKDGVDESEHTDTTVDDYSSISSHDISLAGKPVRRSSRQRAPATWRWADGSDSWSAFDDEIAAEIERSWECGAPEMMFELYSTPYFIDFINYTQTNVATGNTRPIQRMEMRQGGGLRSFRLHGS